MKTISATKWLAALSIAMLSVPAFADVVHIGGQSGNDIKSDVLAFGWIRSDGADLRAGGNSIFIGAKGEHQFRGYVTFNISAFVSEDKIEKATISFYGEGANKHDANGPSVTDANAIKLCVTQLESITGYGNGAGNNAVIDSSGQIANWTNTHKLYGPDI
ncbi:MAG: hypothetical protein AAF585_09670 [Verrucomicrobiota bacterium]